MLAFGECFSYMIVYLVDENDENYLQIRLNNLTSVDFLLKKKRRVNSLKYYCRVT